MKISVSLPEDDVSLLDAVAREASSGRSAAVHRAVELLREEHLRRQYEIAAAEWAESEDAALWAGTETDGISREAW